MIEERQVPLPSLGLLRRYLVNQGWRQENLKNSNIDLFVLAEQGSPDIEIILPRTVGVADAQKRIAQAIRTLSDIETRPAEDVAAAVEAIEYDVLRARLPDEIVFRGSISLEVAQNFLTNARRFLIAAAAAELSNSPFVARPDSSAQKYARECRLGHTFSGSFGFTIESPVGPNSEPSLDSDRHPPPFERRVIQRIARGFQTIEAAAETGTSNAIVTNVERGFNANMCQEFAALVEDSRVQTISFEISLSPEWMPASDLPRVSVTTFRAAAVPIMKEAARVLERKTDDSPDMTLVGRIVRLESRENPADLLHPIGSREVTLEWRDSKGSPSYVKVRLLPSEYLVAVEAHKAGRNVTVSGVLERSNRGLALVNHEGFRVL